MLDSITGCLHLQVMLASRFVKFLGSLRKSRKLGVRLLAGICEHDQRTVLGRTVSRIVAETGAPAAELTSNHVKSKMKYSIYLKIKLGEFQFLKKLLMTKSLFLGSRTRNLTL